jgi:hypothetical protein
VRRGDRAAGDVRLLAAEVGVDERRLDAHPREDPIGIKLPIQQAG